MPRNVVWYPVFGWAPYPDPAWGGPTPLGAVALRFGLGLAALVLLPVVIRKVNGLQVEYAWPHETWEQSFAAFSPGSRTVSVGEPLSG